MLGWGLLIRILSKGASIVSERDCSLEAGDGLGAGADVEFLVDAFDVGANGGIGNGETVRNFLVKKAFREECEDFPLAR